MKLLSRLGPPGQQDVSIHSCSHDPAEHHKVCGSSLGNASPHMDLWRMFVLVFELSRGLLLSEALPAVTLQVECRLISEDDIIEKFLLIHALRAPLQSLCFVGITNCQAISRCGKSPTMLITYPDDSSCTVLDILSLQISSLGCLSMQKQSAHHFQPLHCQCNGNGLLELPLAVHSLCSHVHSLLHTI